MNERHYRTSIARIILYPYCVLGLILGAGLVVVPRGALLIHIGAGACVLIALWLTRQVKRLGVKTTDDGMIVYHPYGTSRLAWTDIVGFDTRRWVINQEVGIRLKNGSRVRTSLVQGRVVTWQGGKTRNILSVLEAEMNSRVALLPEQSSSGVG